jgi:urate oxidase / 2-oxo-4-hydroxy-4-carboxy-5-ureidoimidazoline decarboxylase
VEQFASGSKRNYYGKGDVIAYRLRRGSTPSAARRVFGANVMLLIYGDAFWPTYTTGDNTGLIATDSMKNFIQRETLNFDGDGLERYVHFLASTFLATYPQAAGAKVSATQLPYAALDQGVGYEPAANERASATLELDRTGVIELTSALRGFRLLRLSGSAFQGFVRDEYTTLPDLLDRPLHMWLDLEWRYVDAQRAFAGDDGTAPRVRTIVREVFERFESGSIQQVIYAMGTRLLEEIPEIADVHLEATNRTWDTVAEQGAVGIYTDPRPPFGCLGLRLTR